MKDKGADDAARRAEETREWLESLDYVLDAEGPERVTELLDQLNGHAQQAGAATPTTSNTPYVNTIPPHQQPPFPGSRELEQNIRNILRWNAMIMVVRANREDPTIGGHLSTYASAATLYEVGFNHFFCGSDGNNTGDQIYFQAHTAPGIYARAYLEGRLSETELSNFRHELAPGGGLSSYPHPWLMPEFWQFPSASMGLSPLMAIYQARFNHYLEDRGLKAPRNTKVWSFLGDGETDEPETLGAISLAGREQLDNLIFVINCNLQRLDGPVRGNGKIIQELETIFRGAGWNVIKVIWGSDWDPLLARDEHGLLVRRMGEIVDGQYQKYTVENGAYGRDHFFGIDQRLMQLAEKLTDEQIRTIRRGGHDPDKVYAAYKAAAEHEGSPTVILAKTIKGYGLGVTAEGKNVAHQQKRLDEEALRSFRTRFGIPLSDEEVSCFPFYRPSEDSAELKYLKERRRSLGGYLPRRKVINPPLAPPPDKLFAEHDEGSGERPVSTTMSLVRLLARLLHDADLGQLIVPIVPDEARTFGMESLFRQCGIYSHVGQLYDPVDRDTLLYYKEAQDGQILEEGITEAGSMASFIAAGTAYATHGINTIPFFIFYSMFGMQRVGDLIWAAGDMRTRGFLIGGTSGRTTLNGEGLQHQDGHSHLLAYSVPNLITYDPAFGYELAAIIRDGIRRMYVDQEDIFYYLTVHNESYKMPPSPDSVEDGILKGIYCLRRSTLGKKASAHLFGSGPILNEALKAQEQLEQEFEVATDVWSITSFKELHRDGVEVERWNMLHPDEDPKTPYLSRCLGGEEGTFVVASDFLKALPNSLSRWFPRVPVSLGTDGFGRSDSRGALRDFFEVDARYYLLGALSDLARQYKFSAERVADLRSTLNIHPDKINPVSS